MSEQTIEQKLQSEIVILKSRILDTQDQAGRIKAESDQFVNALGQIAQLVGVTGETVKLEDVIQAVADKIAPATASDDE